MQEQEYVGRYNNGSGYMEWAGQPVSYEEDARAQVSDVRTWADVDIIKVERHLIDGEIQLLEGEIIAWAPLGKGWSDEIKKWEEDNNLFANVAEDMEEDDETGSPDQG